VSTSKHRRASLTRLAIFGIAGGLALGGTSALAVHENVEFPAAVHAGSCEQPGDVVFELPNLVRLPEGAPAEGDKVGAPVAQVVHGVPVGTSLPTTIPDLFAAEHIVAVFNAAGDTIVACGPIGAYTYAEGQDLAIGLREQADSNFTGAAFFTNNDAGELDVSVILVSDTVPPAVTDDATPVA
jgi:hypothetical protein